MPNESRFMRLVNFRNSLHDISNDLFVETGSELAEVWLAYAHLDDAVRKLLVSSVEEGAVEQNQSCTHASTVAGN